MNKISSLAIIEEGAKIGKDVTIAPHCFVSKDSVIGDGTSIAQGTMIYGSTKIGKNNKIFSYAVLGSEPQDLKYRGENVELIIGDNNQIREFTFFNPGTEGGGGKTVIGNNNLFMGYVHVAHDCKIGNHSILANGVTLGGHVQIGDNVVIGGLTPIHQFVSIGDYVMVAGASAVAQDIPPYCLAEGNRASLRGLNLNGMRRKLKREEIDTLKKIYSDLFRSNKPLLETTKVLLKSEENTHAKKLLEFVLNNKRGINYKRDEIANEKR